MVTTTATKIDTKSINITNNAVLTDAVKEWKRLKSIEDAAKAAEKQRKALEEQILNPAMEGMDQAILRGVVVLQRSSLRSNTKMDTDTLKTAFPEAYEAAKRTTTFTFWSVNLPVNV